MQSVFVVLPKVHIDAATADRAKKRLVSALLRKRDREECDDYDETRKKDACDVPLFLCIKCGKYNHPLAMCKSKTTTFMMCRLCIAKRN